MNHAILIVDDSQTVHEILNAVLSEAGYSDVFHAYDTTSTFVELEKRKISLILMDYNLKDTDGIKLTRIIKKIEEYSDIPVIIVTADRSTQTISHAFEAGAIDFVHKPFHKLELTSRIRSALKLKEEIDTRKQREKELIERERELIEINRLLEIANQTYLRSNALDSLTELTNKRYFTQFLQSEMTNAVRKNQKLSLIILDIDHFKLFNDTYGHQDGDSCLKLVAQTIESSLTNPKDIAARIGGEEFAVIVPDCNISIAFDIAEKIRSSIENLKIEHSASLNSKYVTVSLGVAEIRADSIKNEDELFKCADMRLYQSKKNGRNKTTGKDR